MAAEQEIPLGLTVHCSACGIVIPADAPLSVGAKCAAVLAAKLTWFNSKETIRGQHTMATAAWHLIYRDMLAGTAPDAAAVQYLAAWRKDPKKHFQDSLVYKSLTADHITQQIALNPKRDAWFYSKD